MVAVLKYSVETGHLVVYKDDLDIFLGEPEPFNKGIDRFARSDFVLSAFSKIADISFGQGGKALEMNFDRVLL